MTPPAGPETLLAPTEPDRPPAPGRARAKRILAWLGVVVIIAGAVLGGNMFGIRDQLFGSAVPKPESPAAGRDAFARTASTALAPTTLRSAPWWQGVTTLKGAGSTTSSPFTIGAGASQWRVKSSCTSGHLLVRALGQQRSLVDIACPGAAVGYSTQTGATRIQVTSDGSWRAEVAQQIDAPLIEPPLPAMTAAGASRVLTGSFYKIDQTGTGRLTVYRQADGRFSLRLDHFFVSPNSDLQLRLSALKTPRSSPEVARAHSVVVATMDVTAGSLNYSVPVGVDPTRFGSLVVWCVLTNSAYSAATLTRAG